MPTIRTGFKSAAATVWFVEPDLIKGGAGSSKLATPTAAKPIVKPAVKTIRRVWFMRGRRQPVIFVPLVTTTGQAYAANLLYLKNGSSGGRPGESLVHCFDFTDIDRRGFRGFGFNFICPDTAQHPTIKVNIVICHPRR